MHWTRVAIPAGANANTTQAWKLNVTGPTGATVAATAAHPYGNAGYGMVMEFDGAGVPTAYRSWDGGTGYAAAQSSPPTLVIDWGTAADDSDINLNLGNLGSNTNVVSFSNKFVEGKTDIDGYAGGVFDNVRFDQSGVGTVYYTNGKSEKYCRLVVSHCNSPNNLSLEKDGLVYTNLESGPMINTFPNTAPVGPVIPSALEASTADQTEVNIALVEYQQRFANNLAVFRSADKTMEKLNSIIA